MKSIPSPIRFIERVFLGTRDARRTQLQSKDQIRQPAKGVEHLFAQNGDTDPGCDEAPIFIFSAGWRSGSTLLQRLVCSGEDVLIWGEPYDKSNLIQVLARSAAPFSDDWPPDFYAKPSEDLSQLRDQWIANLYPPAPALQGAYRAFLLELFAKPAYALGATRWGVKEVRFGYAEAVFLKSVFPNARFLFLRRRLTDAYMSYKSVNPSMKWYANWPDKPAFTPFGFARHWARLRREIEQASQEIGGILIDYEDLVSGQVDLEKMGDYCGISIDGDVIRSRIGSSKKERSTNPKKANILERLLLSCGARTEQR